MRRLFLLLCLYCLSTHAAQANSINDHVLGGVPTDKTVLLRQGYVIAYDENLRVPEWVAYKVSPDFRNTPPREGKFATFRVDPDITNPVKNTDYNGLQASRGYARGHLAPYGVMGGDRDEDGQTAADGDSDDQKTVFEANYMSNIAPQHHAGFNGSPGLWYQLERWIQDTVVTQHGKTVWVQAGTIFGPGETEVVGPRDDIYVPPMFYKIVMMDGFSPQNPKILAFLFPHQRVAHGKIQHFLVSVDVIEAMTGLNFLSTFSDTDQHAIEDEDTFVHWATFLD